MVAVYLIAVQVIFYESYFYYYYPYHDKSRLKSFNPKFYKACIAKCYNTYINELEYTGPSMFNFINNFFSLVTIALNSLSKN